MNSNNKTESPSQNILTQVWLLDPRDPVVLGDGRNGIAFVDGGTWAFPYPGTVAGMVRSTLLREEQEVTAELALEVLREVAVRGPWLLQPTSDSSGSSADISTAFVLRVPAPADVRVSAHPGEGEEEDFTQAQRLLGGRIVTLEPDEGTVWPGSGNGPELPALCKLPERKEDEPHKGEKLDALREQHWPLELAVDWNLGLRPSGSSTSTDLPFLKRAAQAALEARDNTRFLRKENRMHVVIEDARSAAEAGLLFSSGGLRLEEGWKLGLEVTAPKPRQLELGKHLNILGGESRSCYLEVKANSSAQGAAFPAFAQFEHRYKQRAEHADGLRIQLLSPAYLPTRGPLGDPYHEHGDPAWCPSWLNPLAQSDGRHPALRDLLTDKGLKLDLHAACIPGYGVVSGWNLQGGRRRHRAKTVGKVERTGAPREVRRLVPAGSVYFLRLTRAGADVEQATLQSLLPKLCEMLWGGFIDPENPGEELAALENDFRAFSSCDGYGLILPGYWRKEA